MTPVATVHCRSVPMRALIVAVVIASISGSIEAHAQFPMQAPVRVPDGTLDLEMSILEPRGDFRPGNRVAIGYGARGALRWGPRRAFDVGLAYRSVAHDSHEYNDTLEVKNMLRTLAVSTRYVMPLRHARPYIGASAGATYFGTETLVERCCDENGDRERTLDSIDAGTIGPMASTRFGVVIDLWRMFGASPSTLSADLGVETHYGPRLTYQVGGRGGLRTSGTGYRVYSLGVSLRTR